MRGIRDGIDIGELARSLADGAQILGSLHFRHQPILFDEHHVDKAKYGGGEERQLIGAVGAALIQRFQHAVIGKGAGGIQNAVGHRQGQR